MTDFAITELHASIEYLNSIEYMPGLKLNVMFNNNNKTTLNSY